MLCQGIVPRVMRAMLRGISSFREYSVQFEKDTFEERCFVLFWEDELLKKVCIGSESLEQPVPYSEVTPLSRFICCLEGEKMPLSILGVSPSLLRVLSDNRKDSRRFIVYQPFVVETILQCIRQSYQDVFGMVEITTVVDYTLQRLKSALYEEWTESKVVLRRCVRQGFVEFKDLRALLTDLIDLWSSIRPYIRCTGNPEAKGSSDRVSFVIVSSLLCFVHSSVVVCVVVPWSRSFWFEFVYIFFFDWYVVFVDAGD